MDKWYFFLFYIWKNLNFEKFFCIFDILIYILKDDLIKLKIVWRFFENSFLVCKKRYFLYFIDFKGKNKFENFIIY